ncbi:MAG: hypothetical protein IJT91_06385 [Clostridia bacterium]|nr:hypothetical protein [Clostridia bacterium]
MDEYIIGNISLPYTEPEEFARERAVSAASAAGAAPENIRLYRKSVDARKKNDIRFVYSYIFGSVKSPDATYRDIRACADRAPEPVIGTERSDHPPLICGFGPAGMFAALTLAENGYAPVVAERGSDIERRTEKIRLFSEKGILDTESNVQFGAGGAGMFSDGKLVTRINDPYCRYVLETFCRFGAPREILTDAKPHIGSDVLGSIIKNIAAEIISKGGKIYFDTRLEKLNYSGGKAVSAICSGMENEIPCGAVIAATGHSARDVYSAFASDGYTIVPKPFSVGLRIEHLRKDIDEALYGDCAGDPLLGAASYSLSQRYGGGDAVYSFCMCPGGYVVPAASVENTVVVNGMSRSGRDGVNSNSAIAVTVGDLTDPIGFQEELERRAFVLGGGDYSAPVETLGDYLGSFSGTKPSSVRPTYGRTNIADLSKLFDGRINGLLRKGLAVFGRKIKGFDSPSAVLTGVESRTTAPVRILRDERRIAAGFDNVYPCGEGAGYAGGIMSAAIDGIKTALALMERYSPSGG